MIIVAQSILCYSNRLNGNDTAVVLFKDIMITLDACVDAVCVYNIAHETCFGGCIHRASNVQYHRLLLIQLLTLQYESLTFQYKTTKHMIKAQIR